ncbi:hypothetical protein HED60_11605 [Planctomycetales bacterium ZRK34]|nr:hypothetical protein HED60_11605 [Planctomycetales bacterium ZRK34]
MFKFSFQRALLASAVMLLIQAGTQAQLLDLRTLESSTTGWTGYGDNFEPDWDGHSDDITPPSWSNPTNDSGGYLVWDGSSGGYSSGSGSFGAGFSMDYAGYHDYGWTPWSPDPAPDIQAPQIYRHRVQSVELLDQQQQVTTAMQAAGGSGYASHGSATTDLDPVEFSQYAEITTSFGDFIVAGGRSIAHLDSSANDTAFSAAGKVAASAGANAVKGFAYRPSHSTADASSSIARQATFELKTITQFDLSATLAKAGQMNLNLAIYQDGVDNPVAAWSAAEAQQITQKTYGVLDAGQYTIKLEASASAAASATSFTAYPVTRTESTESGFSVDFKLNSLEYWYYTTTPDGSGQHLYADSIVSVLAPVVEAGWIFVQGAVPSGVSSDLVITSDTDLPDDLLDTVTANPDHTGTYPGALGYLQYVDAYWTGEWASLDMPVSEAYDDLEPTGWYDVIAGQWIDSPLDALRFPLDSGIDEATFLAQTAALVSTPEPAALMLLLTAAPMLRLRRR